MSDFPKLLVVHGDVLMRLSLASGFSARGFQVVVAKNADEALIRFKKHHGKFDFTLVDKEMPDLESLSFLKALRRLNFTGIVVLMSGNLSDADRIQYQRYVTGFIMKGFEIGELASILVTQSC